MPTLTINIAARGTPMLDAGNGKPGQSSVGHMWYSIDAGDGSPPSSYGFAPDVNHHGHPFAPGQVYRTDDTNYQSRAYSRTIDITRDQYDNLKDFGDKGISAGPNGTITKEVNGQTYTFNLHYNGLNNSCIDFVWKAMQIAGLNPSGFEGASWPTWNKKFVDEALDAVLNRQGPVRSSGTDLDLGGDGKVDRSIAAGSQADYIYDGQGGGVFVKSSTGESLYTETVHVENDSTRGTFERYDDSGNVNLKKTIDIDPDGDVVREEITLSDAVLGETHGIAVNNPDGVLQSSIVTHTDPNDGQWEYACDTASGNICYKVTAPEGRWVSLQEVRGSHTQTWIDSDGDHGVSTSADGDNLSSAAIHHADGSSEIYTRESGNAVCVHTGAEGGITTLRIDETSGISSATAADGSYFSLAQMENFSWTPAANDSVTITGEATLLQEHNWSEGSYLSQLYSCSDGSSRWRFQGDTIVSGRSVYQNNYEINWGHSKFISEEQRLPGGVVSLRTRSQLSNGSYCEMTRFKNGEAPFVLGSVCYYDANKGIRYNGCRGGVSIGYDDHTEISTTFDSSAGLESIGFGVSAANGIYTGMYGNTIYRSKSDGATAGFHESFSAPFGKRNTVEWGDSVHIVQDIAVNGYIVKSDMPKEPADWLAGITSKNEARSFESGVTISANGNVAGTYWNAKNSDSQTAEITVTMQSDGSQRKTQKLLNGNRIESVQSNDNHSRISVYNSANVLLSETTRDGLTGIETNLIRSLDTSSGNTGSGVVEKEIYTTTRPDGSNAVTTTTYAYDPANHVTHCEAVTTDTATGIRTGSVFNLNPDGSTHDSICTTARPDGSSAVTTETFVHDAAGHMVHSESVTTDTATGIRTESVFNLNPDGSTHDSICTTARPDGSSAVTTEAFVHDAAGHMVHSESVTTDTATGIRTESIFNLNPDGSTHDSICTTARPDGSSAVTTETFVHDAAGHMVHSESVTTDTATGIRTESIFNLNPDGSTHDSICTTARPDGSSAVTTETFVHDAAGHMVRSESVTTDTATGIRTESIFNQNTDRTTSTVVTTNAATGIKTIDTVCQLNSGVLLSKMHEIIQPDGSGTTTADDLVTGMRTVTTAGAGGQVSGIETIATDAATGTITRNTRTFGPDGALQNEIVTVTQPGGNVTITTLTPDGQPMRIETIATDAATGTRTSELRLLGSGGALQGKVTTVTRPDGGSTITTTDADDHIVTVESVTTDAATGLRTSELRRFDASGALQDKSTTITQPDGHKAVTTYAIPADTVLRIESFDTAGNLTTREVPSYGADGTLQGKTVTVTRPDGGNTVTTDDFVAGTQSVIDTFADGAQRNTHTVYHGASDIYDRTWTASDGSHGTETRAADGSTGQTCDYADGSRLISAYNATTHLYTGTEIAADGQRTDTISDFTTGNGSMTVTDAAGHVMQTVTVVIDPVSRDTTQDVRTFASDGTEQYHIVQILHPDGSGTCTTQNADGSWSLTTSDMQGNAATEYHGTAGNDTLTGDMGNDTLDGGAGADSLAGGLGDDTYMIDNAGDTITENADAGSDIVQSSIDTVLGANLEALSLTGDAAVDGTGNALDNLILGNGAANHIAGGAGNDLLIGGGGDDTFLFNRGDGADSLWISDGKSGPYADAAVETLRFGAGIALSDLDLECSGADLVLGLRGSTDRVTLANWLTDTNRLDAIEFADGSRHTLTDMQIGGTGNDSLTGTDASDILFGDAGNDALNGAGGADLMDGGDGQDDYGVDDSGDIVSEAPGEGTDTVWASIAYTLPENVEILRLCGAAALDGTGNALDNALYGNDADNLLDGAAGADSIAGGAGNDLLIGGGGDDTFLFNRGDGADSLWISDGKSGPYADAAVETLRFGAGIALSDLDLECSGADLVLGLRGSTDRVTLKDWVGATNRLDIIAFADGSSHALGGFTIGTSAGDTLSGTGSGNILFGGAGNDSLTGTTGADSLFGGAGNDTLEGGEGDDTYDFGADQGSDLIRENDTAAGNTDTIQFVDATASDRIWLKHVGDNLEVSVIGTPDKLTVDNWYTSAAHRIEQFKAGDGKVLTSAQVDSLVQAMAAFEPPQAGQTTLPQNYQDALMPVIAANWHG